MQSRAPGRACDPGRHRRDGRAQLRPRRPQVLLEPGEVAELRRLVAGERLAPARLRPHLRRGDAGAARRAFCPRSPRRPARSARRRSATAARSAATSAPPRLPATRCRRSSSRAPRSSSRASRRYAALPLAEFLVGPKRNAAPPDELITAVRRRALGRAADVHEGRPPERDGDRRLLARRRRRPRAWRDRALLRVCRPGGRARAVPLEDARSCPRLVAAAASPIDDVRGTAAYRRHALGVLAAPRAGEVSAHEDRADGQRRAARGRRLAGREPALRAARAARPPRLEERLRAGRVRFLLGPARRHGSSARASCSLRRPTGTRWSTVEGLAERRPAPGAGGVRRGGRRPVRLLHARPRRRDRGPARADAPTRPRTRSARRSRATSAAARGIRRSSTRCSMAAERR